MTFTDSSFQKLPLPEAHPYAGHFPRWGATPLALLQEGARLGKLFRLRLGLPTVVGFSPSWNKRVLTDPETFVGAGSFSRVVPYLSGGIILTDAPHHKPRRAVLNVPFGPSQVQTLRERVRKPLRELRPQGEFDALAWADAAALHMLNAAYFSNEFPPGLLHAFLAPLRQPFPAPLRPRPLLFARFDAELRRLGQKRLADGGDDLLSHLAQLPGGLTEARVSLAAGHDTVTHTLAWAVWHLARFPEWRTLEGVRPALRETLRLYPSGWIGSRRLTKAVEFGDILLPKGALALYSPFLSARDPDFWRDPERFDPARFEASPAPWTYLPFGGGARTCLGMHLANVLLEEALSIFLEGELTPLRGDPAPRPGVTLGPTGPLVARYER